MDNDCLGWEIGWGSTMNQSMKTGVEGGKARRGEWGEKGRQRGGGGAGGGAKGERRG